MSTRFRIPSRPILPQQLADIYDRLDELEGIRGGGIGGIGIGGAGGGIPGSGTPNILAKWATVGSLTDSHLTDTGLATQLVYGSDADPKSSPLEIYSYGVSGGNPVTSNLIMAYARGIRSAPTAVQMADILGNIIVKGCDYAGHFSNDAAAIVFNAAENWTSIAHGTNILFFTTPLGGVVERARVCINADGALVLYQPNSPYIHFISLRVPTDIETSHTYYLPIARPPVSGYVLSCTIDGKMSWIAGGGGSHDLLSIPHPDTLPAPVTRGGLLRGNSIPKWAILPHPGGQGCILTTTAAGDVSWYYPAPSGAVLITGTGSPAPITWLPKGPDTYVLTMYLGFPAWRPATGEGLGGSGTANYISKWTGSTTLGNSSMVQDASGNITITASFASLIVKGRVVNWTGGDFWLGYDGGVGRFIVGNGSGYERMTLDRTTGNLWIAGKLTEAGCPVEWHLPGARVEMFREYLREAVDRREHVTGEEVYALMRVVLHHDRILRYQKRKIEKRSCRRRIRNAS